MPAHAIVLLFQGQVSSWRKAMSEAKRAKRGVGWNLPHELIRAVRISAAEHDEQPGEAAARLLRLGLQAEQNRKPEPAAH